MGIGSKCIGLLSWGFGGLFWFWFWIVFWFQAWLGRCGVGNGARGWNGGGGRYGVWYGAWLAAATYG